MKTLLGNRKIIVSIFAVILLIYGMQGISYAQDNAPSVTPGENNTSLVVRFSDFFNIREQKAYQIQLRRKSPQGDWITLCAYQINTSRRVCAVFHFCDAAATLPLSGIFTDLEPGTTYEARYRDTNVPECTENPPNPDPWSHIGEGTTHLVPPPLVEFVDAPLAKAVRKKLGLDTIGRHIDLLKIPQANLSKLTELEASDSEITDLIGLEHATQLTELDLSYNLISDLTPLAQLTQLTELDLSDNQISDVTPLAQLTQLTELELDRNQISDITPLAQLTQLERLFLGSNAISTDRLRAQLTRIIASRPQLLIGEILNGSSVTLTLTPPGITYDKSIDNIRNALTVSGIEGVLVSDVIRVSNMELKVTLEFTGDLDTQATLTFTIGAEAVSGYEGRALTAEMSVSEYSEWIAFESSVPSDYIGVLLNKEGWVYGVPAKYTSDSDTGTLAYMLIAKLKGCDFANTELTRQSKVYIKTQALGRVYGFTSETVCGVTSRRYSDWDGVRITHLRFFDESSPSNINEAIYNASTDQYELRYDTTELGQLKGDVNGDGIVDIRDLVLVASNLGKSGQNAADVNTDGIVDIRDLVLVAGALGTSAAAPSLNVQALSTLTAADVKKWLSEAQQLTLTDTASVKRYSIFRTTLGNVDSQRDSTLGKLSQPIQSRDMDTVSLGKRRRCYPAYLWCEWRIGADIGTWISSGGDVSKPHPCSVLGW